MFDEFLRSAKAALGLDAKWDAKDIFSCTDRDKPGKATSACAAPPAQPEPPQTPTGGTFMDRWTRAAPAAEAAPEEAIEVEKESDSPGGTPTRRPVNSRRLAQPTSEYRLPDLRLPSYNQATPRPEEAVASSESESSGESYDDELKRVRHDMKEALDAELKQLNQKSFDNEEDGIQETYLTGQLECAVSELSKARGFDGAAHVYRTPKMRRKSVRRRMNLEKQKTGVVPSDSVLPSPRQGLPNTVEPLAGEDLRYKEVKDQLRQWQRTFGGPPRPEEAVGSRQMISHDEMMSQYVKSYQQTMQARLNRLGADSQQMKPRARGPDITKAVREGVMMYHQQCEANGITRSKNFDEKLRLMDSGEKESIAEKIRVLAGDNIAEEQDAKEARGRRGGATNGRKPYYPSTGTGGSPPSPRSSQRS
mmetsp:Transcript_10334/g.32617  ORF Transcript_10334/g.32617 Transcript_10334/m.32617 type:complete len:420 (+) Transcript_10334:108-1367(+)